MRNIHACQANRTSVINKKFDGKKTSLRMTKKLYPCAIFLKYINGLCMKNKKEILKKQKL